MSELVPENYFNTIVVDNANYMQIKREFNITFNDELVFLKYKCNGLSDKMKDVFACNMREYEIDMIPNIIRQYLIFSESMMIVPDSEMNGYLFSCILNQDVNDYRQLRNLGFKTQINNGSRILYVPEEYKMCNINETNTQSMYMYFFTCNPIKGTMNVRVTKNINYIPWDIEFFKPSNGKKYANIITKYGYTAKNVV